MSALELSNLHRYAIVVDTSVARAASETEYPTAIHCRETLETLDDEGYALAMSDPLWDEWNHTVLDRPEGAWDRYASRYTMSWYVSMQVRKRIAWKDLPADNPLNDQIMETARSIYPPESQAPADIEKDLALIETAMVADRRVVSLNDKERRRFKRIAQAPALHEIFWIDPDKENVPLWLCQGAPECPELRLI